MIRLRYIIESCQSFQTVLFSGLRNISLQILRIVGRVWNEGSRMLCQRLPSPSTTTRRLVLQNLPSLGLPALISPGEKPQRIFEDLQGSLKICKDLQKIFEDEDLSRILKGSLKDLWRSSLGKSWCKDPQGSSEDLVRILQGSLWQSGLRSWWGSFRILNNSLRIFQGS